MEFAERVHRRRRELLPSTVAQLLGEERRAYLYGNIAADIINFKGYGGHYNHCHRWTIVDEMRELASTPAEEAFCLGYLSHLAADTIAHNHFVPYHLVRFARLRGLGHLYWELNADRFVDVKRWDAIGDLKRDRTLDELDHLINRTVSKKALSMRTNKLIFSHVLLISERERWRRGMAKLHPLARVSLEKGFVEHFRRAAVERVRLALRPRGVAKLAHIDTNGKSAQKTAMQTRRRIATRFPPGQARRREAEKAAEVYLRGMESPPAETGDPHWLME
jgi:hypothetical protein